MCLCLRSTDPFVQECEGMLNNDGFHVRQKDGEVFEIRHRYRFEWILFCDQIAFRHKPEIYER
jgi:hypothetical protein